MPPCKYGYVTGVDSREFTSEPTAAEEAQWANALLDKANQISPCSEPDCHRRTTYNVYKHKREDGSHHALLCYHAWCEPKETDGEPRPEPDCEPAKWQSVIIDKYVPAAAWELTLIDDLDNALYDAWKACKPPCRAEWSFIFTDKGQLGAAGTRRVLILGYWRCEQTK